MATTRKAIVTRDRVVHTYAELWHASECELEVAERERTGSSFQFLSSIILTAFTLEAFLEPRGTHGPVLVGQTGTSAVAVKA